MYPMSTDEQLRTIFIGRVPKKLSDASLESILRVFPGLQMFIRVPGAAGKPSVLCFVRYSTAASVKCALELFQGIAVESESDQTFVSTCERNTRAWIARNAGSVTLESVTRQSKEQLIKVIQEHVQRASPETTATATTTANAVDTSATESSDVRSAPQYKEESMEDLSSEQQKIVREEVEIFRKFTVIYEKQKSERVQREAQERQKRLDSAAAQVLESRPRESVKGHKSGTNETDGGELEDHFYPERDSESDGREEEGVDDQDWVLEHKYQVSRMKDLQNRFVERERRWKQREKAREAAVSREQAKSSNKESLMEANKAKIMKHLDEFNDDSESTRRAYEYFYDHHSWAKKRLAARAAELTLDRQSEQDESVEERRKQQQQVHLEREKDKQLEKEQQPVTALGSKIRLVFSGSGGAKGDANSTLDQSKVSLETKDPDSKPALPRMPQESESADLYGQTIDLDKLADEKVAVQLRTYLESQIIDLLGIQEDDLINFIMDHVRAGKSPQSLETELEQTLDEDAADFTANLWTRLVELSVDGPDSH